MHTVVIFMFLHSSPLDLITKSTALKSDFKAELANLLTKQLTSNFKYDVYLKNKLECLIVVFWQVWLGNNPSVYPHVKVAFF